MPNIKSSTDLRNNYNEISTFCHESREPVFITKNGYGDMVLMSMELFESTRKKWEVYRDIEISEEQIRQGRTKDARKGLESVREKYGL